MKKTKYIITLLIITTIFSFGVKNTYALKRAIFPDSKDLQPMPKDTHANISGNINSTVEPLPLEQINKPTEEQTVTAPTVANNEVVAQSPNYFLWSTMILLGLIVIFIIYYRNRKTE